VSGGEPVAGGSAGVAVMASPITGRPAVVPAADPSPRGKLVSLSLGDEPDARIARSLAEMERLPYVEQVLALPDVHQKAQMEIPSSIAVRTRDVIVPEFTSVAVNDGMGVVVTDLDAAGLTPERLQAFFTRVNMNSAAHPFDGNRYSISTDELRRVIAEGGRGVLERYGFPEAMLGRFENRGVIAGAGDARIEDVVPLHLLTTRFGRSEMGLNFGGNHFLEVQVVDRLLDREAAAWGLREGQVVVMYHLGPGPFSGTLLHHYSRRTKLKPHRVPMFFVSKLLFHYVQRLGRTHPARAWALHFRHNRWTPYPVDSDEGRTLRRALAMALNFGYAYRLATVRAIVDGLTEAVSPHVRADLLCDVSHNGITEETWGGQRGWIARHNACRLTPGGPAIVAGSHDVASYLGIGLDGGEDGRMHSYDHGAGNLIDHFRERGTLGSEPGSVLRVRMSRGKNAELKRREQVPMRSAAPIELVMECLELNRIVRPAVRLRPLGNFKN